MNEFYILVRDLFFCIVWLCGICWMFFCIIRILMKSVLFFIYMWGSYCFFLMYSFFEFGLDDNVNNEV